MSNIVNSHKLNKLYQKNSSGKIKQWDISVEEYKDGTVYILTIYGLIDGKNISFLESLLQKYAFNQVFFGNMTSENMSRLNRTLKIHWAIYIKNQFRF